MKAALAGAPNILEISDLQAGYWDVSILTDVAITVGQGSMVTIIGPNGSGKSTLLKSIYGLVKIRSGSIMFKLDGNEHELRGLQPHQITVKGINYLPQLECVFAAMSVRENLEIGAISTRRLFDTNLERVLEIFPVLRDRLKARAGALSGGQQKMLGLARALMTDPKLLLLDEPSAGLAPALVDEMFRKVSDINAMGVAILIVEQNARRSLSFSDYGYAMELGRKRFEGPARDLLDDPKVVELYLGNLDRYRQLRNTSS